MGKKNEKKVDKDHVSFPSFIVLNEYDDISPCDNKDHAIEEAKMLIKEGHNVIPIFKLVGLVSNEIKVEDVE